MNARISRGNQYPRVSQPLPYIPVFSNPSSTISRSPAPSFLRYMDLPPHSYFLTSAAPSSILCTVYHPSRRVKWSKAERSGMERCNRPPLMNVILRRRERNTAAYLPPLVPLHPFLPPTHSPRARLDLSCSPRPTTIFSPLSTSTSTYLPTSPPFLYPGSYVSPKSTHNYKTFNLNVKLKRNGFSSVSTVAIKNPCSVSSMIAHRFAIKKCK